MTSSHPNSDDRRSNKRIKTLKTGQIIFDNKQCVMDCSVYDLSDTGARLRPNDLQILPEEFELKLSDGRSFACKVSYVRAPDVGVGFIR